MRPWLIGKGLLSARMRAACGEKYAAHLVDHGPAFWAPITRPASRSRFGRAVPRRELACGGQVWVFAQTVVPDSTLCVHPWLGELGDSAVGEILSDLSGIERSSYEYGVGSRPRIRSPPGRCAIPTSRPRACGRGDRGFRLRGLPMLSQEAFLPAMGHIPAGF